MATKQFESVLSTEQGKTGVGNGDGSDFTIELRVDNLLIYECRVAEAANCSVSIMALL